ncbi:MAG: ACP S-malonyltransferase [Actinobacteria bacterium]|nr:ACP S-malonyltransferase [Actinomycetota bacterium]
MLAILAPGQGSQSPGFLSPWLEDASLLELLTSWSDAAKVDLIRLGTSADADEIRATENAQPLIVAAGMLAARALGNPTPAVTAGHSVGEITAANIAAILNDHDALTLVCERGQAMSVSAAQTATGMSALLGGERDTIIAALSEMGLVAANENGAGQIVAAGPLTALELLAANPPAGVRVRPLAVAGAFHTDAMSGAVARVAEFARTLTACDPESRILSNADGASISSGQEFLARIINQIANPVRWDLCMETMKNLGVTAVIELPPAGTLIGLVKRALPGIETLALKSPADLDAARDLIARHTSNIQNTEKVTQ